MAETMPRSDRRTQDLEERIASLELEYKGNPDFALPRLAEAYLDSGRPRDALRILEKHQNGKSAELSLLLAQACFDTFDNKRSAQILGGIGDDSESGKSLRAQLLLGEIAFEEGRQTEAKQHLKKVRTIDPRHVRAGQLLRTLGEAVELNDDEIRPEPAVPQGKANVANPSALKRTLMQIGAVIVAGCAILAIYNWWAQNAYMAKKLSVEAADLARRGDSFNLRQAEAKYLKALTHQSSNAYAISGLAEVYALLWVDHGFQDAKPKAMEFVKRAKSANLEKAERFSAEILTAYGDNRLDEAEKLAEKIVEKGGVTEKIFFGMGLTQIALGKLKLGRDSLRRAADLKGDGPHFATALGDAYLADNDERNAYNYWSRAKENNSNYVRGVARTIMSQARSGGDLTALNADLERLEKMPPDQLGTADQAAIALAKSAIALRAGSPQAAIDAASKAIELIGESPVALEVRAEAHLVANNVDLAIRDLEVAKEKSKSAPYFVYQLAGAYLDAAKPDLAVKTLKLTETSMGELPLFWSVLGDAYRAQNDYEKANAAYEKALKIWEDFPEALLGKGLVFYQQKKYEDATTWFEKAVGARTKFPDVYIAVGVMWIDQGVAQQGNTQLEHAEKLMRGQGASLRSMEKLYARAIAAFTRNRGNTTYVKQWTERRDKFRKGE